MDLTSLCCRLPGTLSRRRSSRYPDATTATAAAGGSLTTHADHQLRGQRRAAPRSRTTPPVLPETRLRVGENLVKLVIRDEQRPAFAGVHAICAGDSRPRFDLNVLAGGAQRHPVLGTEAMRDGLFAH